MKSITRFVRPCRIVVLEWQYCIWQWQCSLIHTGRMILTYRCDRLSRVASARVTRLGRRLPTQCQFHSVNFVFYVKLSSLEYSISFCYFNVVHNPTLSITRYLPFNISFNLLSLTGAILSPDVILSRTGDICFISCIIVWCYFSCAETNWVHLWTFKGALWWMNSQFLFMRWQKC